MYKIEVIFKVDGRRMTLDESFTTYTKALKAVAETDLDEVQKVYIVNTKNTSDIMIVWDSDSINRKHIELGLFD